MSELSDLLKYCKENDIRVLFVQSDVLHDYSGMNPEAARTMGFPDVDKNPNTKEILIDKRTPKTQQAKDLKHELIEMRLMRQGLSYWPAHLEALKREKEAFDFEPMPEQRRVVSVEVQLPEKEKKPKVSKVR